jgi:hypothetical protein
LGSDLPFFEFGKENGFAGRVIVAAQNGLAHQVFVCVRSLFPETGDAMITEEVRKFPTRK